mmetsp:Transcript_8334/g.17400  ORF Transcript_8334/g.17400 Transcript_8334/m.17400 type:complete len:375 (-) Transcript_8334:262-1386(-)
MTPKATSYDDVYDRQIRLWGIDAQQRMSKARVLYIRLSGVTCEIMKNLVLAGVAAVVCDDRPYPEAVREMPCSFFSAEEMEANVAGKSKSDGEGEPDAKKARLTPSTVAAAIEKKVEELNPLLNGRNGIEERALSSIPDEYFAQFDAIVASRLSVEESKRISNALQKSMRDKEQKPGNNIDDVKTAKNETLFIITDTFGFDGCAHLDFGRNHFYRRELGKDKLSDVMGIDPYVSLSDMLNTPLADVKGKWDKVPPRILLLHRLLMDYWAGIGDSNNLRGKGDKQRHREFVIFAENWLEVNKISMEAISTESEPLDLEHFADIARYPEISPVNAVLGGVLGNEVIKALTGKGEPANNILLFNGFDGGCRSFLLRG